MPFRVEDYSVITQEWDAFVASHPAATVFHTSGVVRSFDNTPKHSVFAKAAVAPDGRVVAILPSTRIETITGIASKFASRAIMFAEPISEDSQLGHNALRQLINLHDEYMQRKTVFAEIRLIDAPRFLADHAAGANYERVDFLNYIIDLSRSKEQLWNSVGKQTRASIRRSIRRGVEIECVESEAAIDRVYRLIQCSFNRSRVPLADVDLFTSVLRELPPGTVQIRVAKFNGRDVAGAIGLVFNGRYFAWYGGTTRIRGICPFACIVWDEIEWGQENGLSWYDFGGAGSPDEDYGPRIFKSRFHGELVNYGRFRKVFSHRRLAIAQRGYNSLNRFIAPQV